MTDYTPEPWELKKSKFSESVFIIGERKLIASVICSGMPDNARRIVACVNACSGISTDELERAGRRQRGLDNMVVVNTCFADRLEAAESLRGELVNALKDASAALTVRTHSLALSGSAW